MRICRLQLQDFIEWDEEKMRFKRDGYAWKTYEMYLEVVTHGVSNWTVIIPEPEENDKKSDQGDADETCLLYLQANKSDVVLSTVHFPINIENVKEGPVIGDYNTVMTTYYNSSVSEQSVSIIDTFNSFAVGVWVVIIALCSLIGILMVVSSIIKSSNNMRRNRTCHLFPNNARRSQRRVIQARKKHRKQMIIDYMLDTFEIIWTSLICKDESLTHFNTRKNDALSRSLLRIILCFYMFWTTFYFTSMVRTELVTVEKPKTINSYQDVLDDKNRCPIWMSSMTDHHQFRNAPQDSMEWKIWQKALKMGDFMIDSSRFTEALKDILDQKRVLIASGERSYAIRSLSCKMRDLRIQGVDYGLIERKDLGKYRTMNSWMRGDPASAAKIRGMAFNSGFNDVKVRSRLQNAFEFGLEHHMHEVVQLDILTRKTLIKYGMKVHVDDPHKGTGKGLDIKHECLSDSLPKPLPTVAPPTIQNFKALFVYQLGLGLFAALICFILEITVMIVGEIRKYLRKKQLKTSIWFSLRNTD